MCQALRRQKKVELILFTVKFRKRDWKMRLYIVSSSFKMISSRRNLPRRNLPLLTDEHMQKLKKKYIASRWKCYSYRKTKMFCLQMFSAGQNVHKRNVLEESLYYRILWIVRFLWKSDENTGNPRITRIFRSTEMFHVIRGSHKCADQIKNRSLELDSIYLYPFKFLLNYITILACPTKKYFYLIKKIHANWENIHKLWNKL